MTELDYEEIGKTIKGLPLTGSQGECLDTIEMTLDIDSCELWVRVYQRMDLNDIETYTKLPNFVRLESISEYSQADAQCKPYGTMYAIYDVGKNDGAKE